MPSVSPAGTGATVTVGVSGAASKRMVSVAVVVLTAFATIVCVPAIGMVVLAVSDVPLPVATVAPSSKILNVLKGALLER